MYRSLTVGIAALLATAHFARGAAAPETEVEPNGTPVDQGESAGGGAPAEAAPAERKSIVPSKYNDGRYKNGGSDPVAEFIKSQAYDKNELVESSFFALARKNGIAEDKVAHYEAQCIDKKQGAAGRARMTLGNMLRSLARKNGKLLNLAGEEVVIEGLAKPAVSGAAAAAQAAKPAETKSDPDGNGEVGDQTDETVEEQTE